MARPRRSIEEARVFGRLVEAELERQGRQGKPVRLEAAMQVAWRCDKRRWGGRAKWFSLWSNYLDDKERRAKEDERRAEEEAMLARLRDHPVMRAHARQLAAINAALGRRR